MGRLGEPQAADEPLRQLLEPKMPRPEPRGGCGRRCAKASLALLSSCAIALGLACWARSSGAAEQLRERAGGEERAAWVAASKVGTSDARSDAEQDFLGRAAGQGALGTRDFLDRVAEEIAVEAEAIQAEASTAAAASKSGSTSTTAMQASSMQASTKAMAVEFGHSSTARMASSTTTGSSSSTARATSSTTGSSSSTVGTVGSTTGSRPKPPTTNSHATSCDGCCPRKKQRPTVVIPFYERDLCKMRVTARSIVKHDPHGFLGKVLICWVSKHRVREYQKEVDEIKDILSEHGAVELVELNVPEDAQGWVVQQAAKLKAAGLVKTDYYVVLDAKNAILRDVEEDTFFTACNQGKIFGRYTMSDMPGLHKGWFENSASVLGQSTMDWGKWPASITPMVMHAKSVLGVLDAIGEPHDFGGCAGGLCGALERSATEFTLYLVFVAAARLPVFDCVHAIEERPWDNELAASIWRSDDDEGSEAAANQVKAIAEHSNHNGRPLLFGAQAGSLDGFSGDWRYHVLRDLAKVYSDAGLYSFDNWDSLATCVA